MSKFWKRRMKGWSRNYKLSNTYSMYDEFLVSRIWSMSIQGMDISMGNWIRAPIVISR